MCHNRNKEPDRRATRPLELVHCDLSGPITPTSRDNYRYAAYFVDDYSGLKIVYCIEHKSDTVHATKKFLAETAPYGTVKRLRSDNGTEFTCKEF